MKKSILLYILLLAFLVLAIGTVAWYVHQVKGVAFYAEEVIPAALLIAELMLSLLLAVLTGLGLGWWLREPALRYQSQLANYFRGAHHTQELEVAELRTRHLQEQVRWQEEMHRQVRTYEDRVAALELRLRTTPKPEPAALAELDLLKLRIKQVERELAEARKEKAELEQNFHTVAAAAPARQEVDIHFLHESLTHLRDNLTEIRGIGPAIEKKLNEQGIYTFQQIAQLTPREAQGITEALKFFPGRIQRDQWVSQAQRLVQQRR